MSRLPFGADSPLDLLTIALPFALGVVLVVAGLVGMYGHRHGTNQPDNERTVR